EQQLWDCERLWPDLGRLSHLLHGLAHRFLYECAAGPGGALFHTAAPAPCAPDSTSQCAFGLARCSTYCAGFDRPAVSCSVAAGLWRQLIHARAWAVYRRMCNCFRVVGKAL